MPEVLSATSPEVFQPEIYSRLRQMAAVRMGRGGMGQTLQPTALVHEAWLRLSKGERRWT